MIDIVFDAQEGQTFCDQKFPFAELNVKASGWSDYAQLAQDFIKTYAEHKSVIIQVTNNEFSINKFSVALFVESIQMASKLDYVVFKVQDLEAAREAYKPYLALTIAIKYVLQLVHETPEKIYKNISELGYLGLTIKSDYLKNMMSLRYEGAKAPVYRYKTQNAFEALVMAGLLKTASLAKIQACFEVEAELNMTERPIDVGCLVAQIMRRVSFWIN